MSSMTKRTKPSLRVLSMMACLLLGFCKKADNSNAPKRCVMGKAAWNGSEVGQGQKQRQRGRVGEGQAAHLPHELEDELQVVADARPGIIVDILGV